MDPPIAPSKNAKEVKAGKGVCSAKGSKKGKGVNPSKTVTDLTDEVGEDDSSTRGGKKMREYKQKQDEKYAALRKQLEDVLAQNKENEKKRKIDEADIAAKMKALKKKADAAEKLEKLVEDAQQEKEEVMAAVAKLREEQQSRKVMPQQPFSDHSTAAIAQPIAFQPQQSMHQIMSAAQYVPQLPSYPSMSCGQQNPPLPFMSSQPYPPHALPSTEPSNNIYSYIHSIEMMRLLAGRR